MKRKRSLKKCDAKPSRKGCCRDATAMRNSPACLAGGVHAARAQGALYGRVIICCCWSNRTGWLFHRKDDPFTSEHRYEHHHHHHGFSGHAIKDLRHQHQQRRVCKTMTSRTQKAPIPHSYTTDRRADEHIQARSSPRPTSSIQSASARCPPALRLTRSRRSEHHTINNVVWQQVYYNSR